MFMCCFYNLFLFCRLVGVGLELYYILYIIPLYRYPNKLFLYAILCCAFTWTNTSVWKLNEIKKIIILFMCVCVLCFYYIIYLISLQWKSQSILSFVRGKKPKNRIINSNRICVALLFGIFKDTLHWIRIVVFQTWT